MESGQAEIETCSVGVLFPICLESCLQEPPASAAEQTQLGLDNLRLPQDEELVACIRLGFSDIFSELLLRYHRGWRLLSILLDIKNHFAA